MLYITTRDKFDTFTEAHALRKSRAANGGLFLPFRMPAFSNEEIGALKNKSFGQTVAETLNAFFFCGMTGWDVEFAIGRYPAKLTGMNHRIWIAELWHNQSWEYAKLERSLSERICPDNMGREIPSWVRIAIRIAVLFAVYGEMLRADSGLAGKTFDAAVPTGDFSAAMALWYARSMGLPVGNIVCGCNENSAVWDLLHIGEFRTDTPVETTTTKEADIAVPEELERLIHATLGIPETQRYCEICGRGDIYSPRAGMLEPLRKGMFSAVVSQTRLEGLIPSVYHTSGCILSPYTALAYGALQDYRAKTGESRTALLLADKNPVCDGKLVASAMGISEGELKTKLQSN